MKSIICAATILALTASAAAQWQWSEPVSIAPTLQENYHDTMPEVVVDPAGTIAAAWVQQNVTGTSVSLSRQSNILISYSTNQGQTWTDPDVLSSPEHYDGEVDLTAGAAGEFFVTWTSGDFFSEFRLHTARTVDGGQSYTFETITDQKHDREYDHIAPQVAIASNGPVLAKSSINYVLYQQQVEGYMWSWNDSASTWTETGSVDSVAQKHTFKTTPLDVASADDGTVIAAFNQMYLGNNNNDHLTLLTSIDAGATWTKVANLAPSSDLQDGAITEANGTWVIAATASKITSNEPFSLLRSQNDGTSWSITASLPVPDNDIVYLDYPSIATDGNGTWLALCHGGARLADPETDGEILYTISTDDALTWSPLQFLGGDPATNTAIETAPAAAYLGSGKWAIFYSRANDEFTDSDIVMSIADTSSSSINDWQIY